MRRALLVPALVLGACAHLTAAATEACPSLEAEAAEITALRDADASRGLTRGEATLERARARPDRCPAGEALLLAAIGSNLHILGRNHDALSRYREAIEMLPESAAGRHRATIHRGAGNAAADVEDFSTALEHYMAALTASREVADNLEAAKTGSNIGNLYSALGELERSREYHRQALEDFRAAGFKPGVAGTLVNLGAVAAKFAEAAQASGDRRGARRENRLLRDYNEQALAIFTELGNERGIAYATSNIALALERLGEPAQALVQHERALELRRRIGDVHGQINSHATMASTLTSLGRHHEARTHLEEAQAILPTDNHAIAAEVARKRVEVAEAQADYAEALRWQREVTRLQSAMANEDHSARVAELEGRFQYAQQAREIELLRSNGELRELQLERQRLYFHVSVIVGALLVLLIGVIFSRMRLGRATARELQRAARTDPVTGLANRRHTMEALQSELQRAQRSGRPFAGLMVDVDRFKAINDTFGHGAGDAVLHEIAQRLSRRVRAQDTVGRWGGEEFLILLPDTDIAGARALGEAIRAAVSSEPILAGPQALTVRVTVGAAQHRAGMNPDDVVNAADQAMYHGKRQGGDRMMAASGAEPVAGT